MLKCEKNYIHFFSITINSVKFCNLLHDFKMSRENNIVLLMENTHNILHYYYHSFDFTQKQFKAEEVRKYVQYMSFNSNILSLGTFQRSFFSDYLYIAKL